MANSRDISIATMNLLNLHLPGERIYSDRDGWSESQYQAKTAWIGTRLKTLDADIIGFQECWSRKALEDWFAAAGLLDQYDIIARDTDPPGIQVALATRKGCTVGTPEWIDDFPESARFTGLRESRDAEEAVDISFSRFSRAPLRVRVQPKGSRPKPPPINVYVVHLKSKGPTSLSYRFPRADILSSHAQIAKQVVSHVRRIVEAGALRAILDEAMKDNTEPFIVMGDLNDNTLSTSTELLSGNPGYRFIEKSSAGSKSDAGLYSVEKLQQLRAYRDVYYTYIYKQKVESLDHILVSDAFYDHSVARCWSFRETEIYNDHLNLSKKEQTACGASDHGIVKATFDWNPIRGVLERL